MDVNGCYSASKVSKVSASTESKPVKAAQPVKESSDAAVVVSISSNNQSAPVKEVEIDHSKDSDSDDRQA